MNKKEVIKKTIIHGIIGTILSMIIFYLVMEVVNGIHSVIAYIINCICTILGYIGSYLLFSVYPDKYDVQIESFYALIGLCSSIFTALCLPFPI